MKSLIYIAIIYAASSVIISKSVTAKAEIKLEKNGLQVTFPLIEDKRVTYSGKDSKTWRFFTVKNIGEPNHTFYSNISQEGSIALLELNQSLEELAQREYELHAKNYTYAKIADFNGEAKLLLYEDKKGTDTTVRRVFLWWKAGNSIIMLDFTYSDYVSGKQAKDGRLFVEETLRGMRINGQPVPYIEPYLKVLEYKKNQ